MENVKNTISEPLDLKCFFGGERMPLDPSTKLAPAPLVFKPPISPHPRFLQLKKDSAVPVNSYPAASAAVAF